MLPSTPSTLEQKPKHELERDLALRISRIFAEEVRLKDCLNLTLYQLCLFTGHHIGEVWISSIDFKELKLVGQFITRGTLQYPHEKIEFNAARGLIGRAWKEKAKVELYDLQHNAEFMRPDFARTNNLHSGTALPVMLHNTVVAVLAFYTDSPCDSVPLLLSENLLNQLAGDIQRKKVEEELEQFFTLSPDLLAIANMSGYLKKVNRACVNILGYTEEELTTTPILEFIHPDDQALVAAGMNKLIEGELVTGLEARMIAKDKSIKWIAWSGSSLADNGLLFGVGKDITENKRLEHSIRAERERFKRMLDEAPVGMCVLKGPNHEFQIANAEYYKLTGKTPDIIGKTVAEVFPEVQHQGYMEWLSNVYKTGETFSSNETPLRLKDDKGRYMDEQFISFMYQPFHNEAGEREAIFYVGIEVTEQVRTRRKVEENERRFRAIFEQAAVGVALVHSTTGRILQVNKKYCEIFGYSRDELERMTFMDFSHPDDLANDLWHMDKLIQGHIREFTIEKRLFKKDSTVVWTNLTVSPLWRVGEPPVHHIAILQDISARKEAEEKIFNSQQLLNESQKITHTGSWEWTISKNNLYWSDELCRIFGIPVGQRDDTVDHFLSFTCPADRQTLQQHINNAIADKNGFEYIHKIIRPSGEPRYIHSKGNTITDAKGKVERLQGVCMDITDRKRSEDELIKLSLIAQKTVNAVVVTDTDRKIVWVNEAFTHITEFKPEEAIGRGIEDLLYGKETDTTTKKYIRDQVRKMQPYTCELLQYTQSGRPIWVEIQGQPIVDAHGVLTHYFDIKTDITERKKFHQELVQSKEETRSFARQLNKNLEDERARIAREIHDEFGQQLTGLKMSLSSLKARGTKEEMKEIIAGMVQAVEDTMKSLRSFSTELRPGLLDTLGLIPTLEWLTQEFEKKNGLPCRFKTSIQSIPFEKEITIALFRICQEALNNIVKHAQASKAMVTIRKKQNKFILEISDDGRGMTLRQSNNPYSMGILGMRERAHLIGADFSVATEPAKGTIITVKLKMS